MDESNSYEAQRTGEWYADYDYQFYKNIGY